MPAAQQKGKLKPKDKCRLALHIQTQDALSVSCLFAGTDREITIASTNQCKAPPSLAKRQSYHSMDVYRTLNTIQTLPIHMTSAPILVLLCLCQVGAHLHKVGQGVLRKEILGMKWQAK